MRENTVSVIIPAYGAARTIGRAIESVLGQTRPPVEILVVDDGSTDDLASALQPYLGLVRLISKPNGGAASARNLGIDQAQTNVIAFLDADDMWEPGKLEHQFDLLQEHPEVGLFAGRFYEQPPGQVRVEAVPVDHRWMGRVLTVQGAAAMELAARVWTSTVVVRREALGVHRFVTGLEPAEDRDLWFRVISSTAVHLSPRLLATQVLEPGSLSRSSLDVDCGNMLRVLRRHADLLGRRGLRSCEADCYRRWAGNHLAQGRPGDALKPALNHLRLRPYSLRALRIVAKAALMAWRRGSTPPSAVPGVAR